MSLTLSTPVLPPGREMIRGVDSFSGVDVTQHVGYPWASADDSLRNVLDRHPEKCDVVGACWGADRRSSALGADRLVLLAQLRDEAEPPERLWALLEGQMEEMGAPPRLDESTERGRAFLDVQAAMLRARASGWLLG